MTRQHLFVFALWLPLLLLAIISIGEAMLKHFWWHQMSTATLYFLLSGMLGGLQYLLFAIAITWLFGRMDGGFLVKVSWALPVMFFPVGTVGIWLFFQWAESSATHPQGYDGELVQQNILGFCIRLGMYSVLSGYAYVFSTHMLGALLSRLGLMED